MTRNYTIYQLTEEKFKLIERLKLIYNKVEEVFKNNDLYYDWGFDYCTGVVEIYVEWGDRKHDHICLRNTMQENGFALLGEEVTEEDGSDTYSSTHYYILKV